MIQENWEKNHAKCAAGAGENYSYRKKRKGNLPSVLQALAHKQN